MSAGSGGFGRVLRQRQLTPQVLTSARSRAESRRRRSVSPRLWRTVGAVAGGLCWAFAAYAQDSAPITAPSADDAKVLIATGQLPAALELLQRRYAADARDVETLFLLGMVALGENDYARATGWFRRALVIEPSSTRIRLELARALYLDRRYEDAFRQFQRARAGNPPPAVIAAIDRFMAAIRHEKRWSYSVNVAIAPDTNINNATSARQAEIFGLPFELDDASRARSGVGLDVGASAEFAPRISNRASVRLGVSAERREYAGRDFDDMTVSGHAGPRLSAGKWDLSLLAAGFARWYGAKPLNRGGGGRIEATWYRSSRTALNLSLTALATKNLRSPEQSGLMVYGVGTWSRAIDPSSAVTASLGLVRQYARSPEQANWTYIAAVSYQKDLPRGFSVQIEPRFLQSYFGAADPFFGKTRRDTEFDLRLGVSNRRIVFSRFTPQISYAFATRSSSIALFAFTQSRVEIGVTSAF